MNEIYFQDKKVIEQIEVVHGADMEEEKSVSTNENGSTAEKG